MNVIVRRELPHPGATLDAFEIRNGPAPDGKHQVLANNQQPRPSRATSQARPSHVLDRAPAPFRRHLEPVASVAFMPLRWCYACARGAGSPSVSAALPPLTPARWLTQWSLNVPALLLAGLVVLVYVLAARRVRLRGGQWDRSSTSWFVCVGVGSWLLVTCSILGTYSRVLFWPLAVQDVLLMTLVPVGVTLGRPVALWRSVRPRSGRQPRRGVVGSAGCWVSR